jgi:hypothetical protein
MFAKYSNGWGHLVVTLAAMIMVSYLLVTHALDATACIGIIAPVITFWFMSGTVNRFNTPVTGPLTPSQAASPLPPISVPSTPPTPSPTTQP